MKNRIFLRAFEPGDIEKINLLRNDEDSYLYTAGNKYFISKENDRKWIEDKIFNNHHQIYLAICLESGQLIGYTSINDIDYRNRKAQWGGINIEKESSGKGYGTDVGKLILAHIFEELGFNRVYSYVLESNLASLRMTEKLGFVREGLIREFVFKKDKFHNAYLISMLKEEYNSLFK